jgi:hypothetical protein
MASLMSRISDLITAIGTDIKQHRTWITGSSSGNLTGLTTTAKTDLVAAVNEVNASVAAGVPDSSETVKGKIEIATQAETNTGTDDLRAITPLKLQTRMAAYAQPVGSYQPLDSDLTAIAALTTTAFGRSFLDRVDAAAGRTLLGLGTAATQASTAFEVAGAAAAAQAASQPLDSDLTAIAALTTTAYGRAFLALADQAALQALLGLDTDVALAANSDLKIATQKATKAYADSLLDANNAWQYKGVIDASANPNYPAASAGHTYRISVAGKIGGASGINVEVGDTITALVDGSAAGNQATVGANWTILQTNIDGAVVGPASSVSADLATFSGTTGKIIADSGVSISTDGTLATNNNTKIPTEGAIRTYLGANYYNQTAIGNPDTDLAAAYATAKA